MPLLDPQLRDLLASLRRRVRRYIVADAMLALIALVLSAFWIGLLVDFVPVRLGGTEMPRSARTLLLVVVGMAVVVLFGRLLVQRLRRPLPDDSLALLIERHHPELGGRLVTAVQLERQGRQGDSHAPALLRRVHAEAASLVGGVDFHRIFRFQPLAQKAWVAGPLVLATILLGILSPASLSRAAGRLLLLHDTPWPRQAHLEMVGVELPEVTADQGETLASRLIEFDNRVARLPRGSSGALRVVAAADGEAIVPELCTVYFTTAGGARGQANMRRVGRPSSGYQTFLLDGPPLAGLNESVTISVRGLDARLDGYRIEAVEPPALARMQVTSTDPAYLRPDADAGPTSAADDTRQVDYQSGLRIREGAAVRLSARSSTPLGRVDARMLVAGQAVDTPPIQISDDGSEFSLTISDLRQPTTLIVVPEDRQGISAQVPYRYFLGVVLDEQPEVKLRLRGIGSAVTPQARIPVHGTAVDDYQIDTAAITLSVADQSRADDDRQDAEGDAETGSTEADPEPTQPAGLEAVNIGFQPDPDGRFRLTIDLRELAASDGQSLAVPEPGGALNLIAEVTDRYDLDGRSHRSTSQLYRLDVVTPENLLALLERRELALRSRLEQTIQETRSLRQSLVRLESDWLELAEQQLDRAAEQAPAETPPAESPQDAGAQRDDADDHQPRQRQVLRLRAQQIGLQTTKTGEELEGIATSLDDLLEEMANNRVDSPDRSERIGSGVRDPLRSVIAGDLTRLSDQSTTIRRQIEQPGQDAEAAESIAQAVQTADDVLLQLTAILERMLELESFNEILDIVRELLDGQDGLIDQTKQEQKRRVLDLFD